MLVSLVESAVVPIRVLNIYLCKLLKHRLLAVLEERGFFYKYFNIKLSNSILAERNIFYIILKEVKNQICKVYCFLIILHISTMSAMC